MQNTIIASAARNTTYLLVTIDRARRFLSGDIATTNRAGVLTDPAASLANLKAARQFGAPNSLYGPNADRAFTESNFLFLDRSINCVAPVISKNSVAPRNKNCARSVA